VMPTALAWQLVYNSICSTLLGHDTTVLSIPTPNVYHQISTANRRIEQ